MFCNLLKKEHEQIHQTVNSLNQINIINRNKYSYGVVCIVESVAGSRVED